MEGEVFHDAIFMDESTIQLDCHTEVKGVYIKQFEENKRQTS